jgi:outer membrane protein assembly factor BamB
MKVIHHALALVALLACAAPSSAALDLPLLWTAELNTVIENAATAADLNGDGQEEALIAGYTQLIALRGDGKVLWEWENKDRLMTYPAVLMRPGGMALIYTADWGGNLTCLDGGGKEIWRAKLKGPTSWSASVVCDLSGDGKPEVVQTDSQGTVWAFDALTGAVIWQASVQGAPVSPAVADIDGDGKAEVVVATGSAILAAFRSDGSPLWNRALGSTSPSWQTSAPVIFTAADGEPRIAVGSSGGEIFCLAADAHILWQHSVAGPVASSISIADFDNDGLADIFLVTERGVIYRFREDGKLLWVVDMRGRSLAPGAIVDIDADGRLEYVLSTQNGHLLVLGQQGEFLLDRWFEHRTINTTPAFGHLARTSPGLEMVITGGEAGRVLCFGTRARAGVEWPWPSYRHDMRMSGSAVKVGRKAASAMTPENLAWDKILCGEGVRFNIINPSAKGKPLIAAASCLRPDGTRQTVNMGFCGSRAELVLPVEVLAPGVYAFRWRLDDAGGKAIASGSQGVFLQPFASERGLFERASAALRSAADAAEVALPLSAAALRREARLLDDSVQALLPAEEAALAAGSDRAVRSGALARTAALVASAQRGLKIAEVVRQAIALGPGTSVIAFEPADMWENRAVRDELPTRVLAPLRVQRRAVPGEHEPVAVNLFNLTDRALRVRVRIERSTTGPAVAAYRAMEVPTPMGELAWDALPELDESAAIAIPSLSGAQLWLDLDLSGVQPGNHEVTVRFQAIDGAGVLEGPPNRRAVPAPEAVAKIALQVLPFEIAPPGAFRLCTWGQAEGSQYGDYPEATYDNLLAHGNNVFPVGGLPAAEYDSKGTLTRPLDYAALDAMISRFRGKDVVLLLGGYPPLHGVSGAGEYGSQAYRAALKTYLADVAEHLRGLGFDREHFALYPVDEPGGAGWPTVRALVELGQMVRAANRDIMIYVDGGGDVLMFKALAPVVDIWSPPIGAVGTEPEKIAIMRGPGKQLWSYDCGYSNATASGRSLKAGDLVAMYRTAAISAFRYDLTGAGFWTSIAGPDDPWTRTEGYEYMILYPGRTKPVTSRRWEAAREGIEDFRILTALRSRLRGSGEKAPNAETRARISHLLDLSVPRLADNAMNSQQLPQHLDEALNAVRAEMMGCVAGVTGSAPGK